MLNLDSKRTKNSGSKPTLSNSDKDQKSLGSSVFTLNDGIKLLQSCKNLSKEEIIKMPNLKFSFLSDKKISEKIYLNHDRNIISINPLKGKSIFNNSILDNVLGTINPNEQIAGNQSSRKNEPNVIYSSESLNKEFNSSLGIHKTSCKQSKESFSDKFKNNLNNLLDDENKKGTENDKEKDNYNKNETNKESISPEKRIKGNLYKMPFDRIFKNKINSEDDLKISYEISKSSNNKANKHVSFTKNINALEDNENSNLNNYDNIDKNYEDNNKNRALNKIIDNNNNNNLTNCECNINNNNNNSKNNETVIHICFLKNSNTINQEEKIFSPNDNKLNNNKNHFSYSALVDNLKVKTQMHNKELKFEIYKHNKLLEPQKDLNNINEFNYFNSKNSFKQASNDKKNRSSLNLQFNLESINSKIEVSTQTRNNFTLIFDEKNSITKHSEKERIFNCACKEKVSDNKNQLLDMQNENGVEKNSIEIIKLKNENETESGKFKEEFFLGNKTSKENVVSDSHRKSEYATDCDFNKSEFEKGKNLNGFCSSTRYNDNKYNETQKDCLFNFIKRSNFFSPVHQVNYNFIKGNCNYDNNENNGNENLASANFTIAKSTSSNNNRLINNRFNINDFNKEIFKNSKILRENLISTYKNKKKSQTSQMPKESTNGNRILRIKFSNNVKMKKKLMEIISPDAAKEYIREHENKTFDLNKDRLIQKLPVIDFKN